MFNGIGMGRECEEQEKERNSGEVRSDCIAKFRRGSRNRESYDEIAELEAELRRAYVAKEWQAQLMERNTERFVANVRKQQAAKLMQLEQQAALDTELRRKHEAFKKCEDYKEQLTEQITRQREERSIVAAKERIEREVLTEVDRIREEHEKSRIQGQKTELAEHMRRERLIVQEMKVIRRQEEMEAEATKFRKDQMYLMEIDERVKEVKKLREEREQKRERALSEIANILINAETRRQERETLIAELIAEDVKRELLIREEEQASRRKKMKEDLAADLEEQIDFSEQCKLRFVMQDRAFAEEIMKKIMEDEKTARLTAEARRRMQLQYRDDLSRLIEERGKIREIEIIKMRDAAKEERKYEIIRLDHVREMKTRLLEQHASNVADFLNKDTFTEDEREIIAQSLKSERDVRPKT